MTPADEDALIEQSIYDASSSASVNWRQAIRLAIRAAVAAERERASKDVLDLCDAWQMEYGQETAFDAGMVSGLYTANKAIRGDFSSLPSGVVEVNSFAGRDGNSGLVPSAAKEGVERRACDCENYTVDGCGISCLLLPQDCFFIQLKENVYCRLAQRNLP